EGTGRPRLQPENDACPQSSAVDLDGPFDRRGRVATLAEKLLESFLVALVLDLVNALALLEFDVLAEALPNSRFEFVRSLNLDLRDSSRLALFNGDEDRDLAGVDLGITLSESSR